MTQQIFAYLIDTPGFADSHAAAKWGANLYQANLQSMRWIVRRQQEHGLAFYRVLYFLPERGPLERADRGIQEEIKVIVHFFGDSIFYNMVIIATWPPRQSKGGLEFEKEDINQTERSFTRAMKIVRQEEGLEVDDPESELTCPPVVYISLKDTPKEVLEKVRKAKVQGKAMPTLRREPSPPGTPAHLHTPQPAGAANLDGASPASPTQLIFRNDVCAKCAVRIITLEGGQKIVRIGDNPEENIRYEDSRCHPALYPKYTSAQRVLGGFAHVATLGLGLLIGDVILGTGSWPGFTNADEVCPTCANPPGSPGCAPVLQACETPLKGGMLRFLHVDHTNKVE